MDNHPELMQCLNYLCGVCDGATSEDNQGFNGYDAPNMHDINSKAGDRNLSVKQHNYVHRTISKYIGQLTRAGISLPTWTSVQRWLEERDRRIAEELAKQPPGWVMIEPAKDWKGKNYEAISLYFPWAKDEDYQSKRKRIESLTDENDNYLAHFNGSVRAWQLPHTPENLRKVVLTFPEFEPKDEATGSAIATIAQALAAEAMERQHKLDRKGWERWALQQQLDLDAIRIPTPDGDKPLYQHQKDGFRAILDISCNDPDTRNGAIVADVMGLGKTVTSLLIAKAYQKLYDCPVFVICPVALKDNPWKREAERMGVNVEIFSAHHLSIPKPLETEGYVVIADEATYFQNGQALRTKAAKALIMNDRCRCFLPLSGTPLANADPMNLFALLEMLNHPISRNKKFYTRQYCRGGGSHLDELHKILIKDPESRIMIRRDKKLLKDLPPKLRAMREATISPAANKVYMQAFNRLREEYYDRISKQLISSQGEVLVMLTHLRHAGSIAKIEETVAMATELIQDGEPVVIFVAFRDTADEIAKQLSQLCRTEVIDGESNASKQTSSIVDRFQQGITQALVCVYGASAWGLTLTASSYVIATDRPWTSTQMEQAEDRCHRIGQANTVFVTWIQAFEIDYRIDKLLEAKQKRIDLVLSGKRKTFQGIDDIGDIARELLDDIFG